jgi:YD repeat-containing protein
VSYTYDGASRLTQVYQGESTTSLDYAVDARQTTLTLPNGIVTESTYDPASRLIGLTYKLGGTTLGTLTYTCDAAGDQTLVGGTWARVSLPSPVASTSYNANNQQLTFGAASMTYDLNGSLLEVTGPSGTTTYSWSARHELSSLSGPTRSGSFG